MNCCQMFEDEFYLANIANLAVTVSKPAKIPKFCALAKKGNLTLDDFTYDDSGTNQILQKEIGNGFYSTVYLVKKKANNFHYALKVTPSITLEVVILLLIR